MGSTPLVDDILGGRSFGQLGASGLASRMAQLMVPGAAIAVIREGAIEARGFGVTRAGGNRTVTPDTLFQACSISKGVTALIVLRLVADGVLDLDRDVNSYLTSWRVPANLGWQPHITLRQLLSHTAGTTVHGFPGYRVGGDVPTLLQVLNGEPPANTPAVRVNLPPGATFRYSGGGTSITQQVLVDVLESDFPAIARAVVLDPLGMVHTTFEQPLPSHRGMEAASGHDQFGRVVEGEWPVHPEMAAAGMWTSARDLAQVVLALQGAYSAAARGSTDAFLTPEVTRELFTPAAQGPYGLGFTVADVASGTRFGHSGANFGYRCALAGVAQRPEGVVVMTNGDSGSPLVEELVSAAAAELGWDAAPTRTDVPNVHRGEYVGQYLRHPGYMIRIVAPSGSDVLRLEIPHQPPLDLVPMARRDEFAVAGLSATVIFKFGGGPLAERLEIRHKDGVIIADRSPPLRSTRSRPQSGQKKERAHGAIR